MIDNYEHYITRNIKAFYKRRLFSPIVYLIILFSLWFIFPLRDIYSPNIADTSKTLEATYNSGDYFVKREYTNLYFTGYTRTNFMGTSGYYYYTVTQNGCDIVLLSPDTCEEGLPTIEKLTVTGRIRKGDDTYKALMDKLSADLKWTVNGLQKQVSEYYFSEPDTHKIMTRIMFIFYFGSMIYAFVCLIMYTIFIDFPYLSPTCQKLAAFGNARKMLEEAEEELATLPQLATEDMFITEHYFILTSPYGNAVVPIREILWIYKYSTLHKILWYHFSISYTLYISANKHLYIHCPKNTKSDIDGIIDYLSEANHDILVGFNEENRLRVQAIQGQPFHIEKLAAILKKG